MLQLLFTSCVDSLGRVAPYIQCMNDFMKLGVWIETTP